MLPHDDTDARRTPRGARRGAARRDLIYAPEDPLLTPREVAAERNQALSTFWRDLRLGNRGVPRPIYIGPRVPRWRRSEVRAALEALRAQAEGGAAMNCDA
jgi:predicted DNA-binding transcriptional regulator AlpA